MPGASGLLTYEDSLLRPVSRYEEIVNGELFIVPPGTWGHVRLITALRRIIERALGPTPLLVCEGAGIGISREPFHCRIPDLVIVTPQALQEHSPYYWGPPLFVAECLLPSNRKGDPVKLMREYQRIGTAEAWAIEPETRKISRYFSGAPEPDVAEGGAILTLELPQCTPMPVIAADLWAAFAGR